MPERPQGLYAEEDFAPSAARTASGDSGVYSGYGAASTLRAQLNVTAFTVAAGNTLDVVIEDTVDGTNWNVVGTFAQKTGVGREVINITGVFSDRVRARWTIGGTPGATFGVRVVSQLPSAA